MLHLIFPIFAQPQLGSTQESLNNANNVNSVSISVSVVPPSIATDKHDENVGIIETTAYLKVIPDTDKDEYYRNENIEASYNISSNYVNSVKIEIPDEFIDLMILKCDSKNVTIDGKYINLILDGKADETKNLIYKARISINARLNGNKSEIDIGSNKVSTSTNCYKKNLSSHKVIIKNNEPKLTLMLDRSEELNRKGLSDILLSNTRFCELFNDETSNLILNGSDIEDSNISYQILIQNNNFNKSIFSGYLNNTKKKDGKIISLPATKAIEIEVKLSDRDGFVEKTYMISRNKYTISEYTANQMKLSISILVIVLLISLGIKKYFGRHLLKLLIVVFLVLIILLGVSIWFEEEWSLIREVAIFEVWVYLETFILFSIFIK
jgi:hypothetical protein